MKRLTNAVILLLGLSMAMMTSCSKDNSSLIVGRWEATNTVGNDYYSREHLTVYQGDKFRFTEDGFTSFPFGELVDYEIDGDTLIIYYRYKFIIDELTSSTLKLRSEYYDGQLILNKY